MKRIGLMVVVGLCACSGEVVTQGVPQLPGGEPAATIQASGDSTNATGVVEWKAFEEENGMAIYGVDQAGQVVIETTMHAAGSEQTRDQSIVLEQVFPSRGVLEIATNGTIVRNTISATAQREVLQRMATDFKAVSDSEGQHLSFSCFRATVYLVGACGATIAGCLESAGALCGFGSLVCLDAYWNWLCHCRNKRWAC
jgi:hypothetical protein